MAALDLQQANEAIVHFGRALAIRHADNDQLHIAILLNNMAGALFDRGERDHAINCMRESLRILDELGDSHDREMVSDKRMLALANLTEAYRLLGQLPEASEYGVEYLAQATELDNRWQQVGALEELGHIYRLAGDRAKALDHLTRCLEMSAALNYRYGVARAHRQLGELLSVDVPDEARAHLRDAYEIFAELGDPAASAVQALLDGPDRPDHPSRPAELDGAADLDHDEPRVTTDGVDPDDERQTVDQ
jgi:tetratricopeptide (TPR) repeat protein